MYGGSIYHLTSLQTLVPHFVRQLFIRLHGVMCKNVKMTPVVIIWLSKSGVGVAFSLLQILYMFRSQSGSCPYILYMFIPSCHNFQSIASALFLTRHCLCAMYRLHKTSYTSHEIYCLYSRRFSLTTLVYIIYVLSCLSSYVPFPVVYPHLSLLFTSLMLLIISCS